MAKYIITAYKTVVGGELELKAGSVPVGIIYPEPTKDLYVVCLEPREELGLPAEEGKEESEEKPERGE